MNQLRTSAPGRDLRRYGLIVLTMMIAGAAAIGTVRHLRTATADPPAAHDGQEVFRYQTFGDEQNWTGFLRMHEVIESAVDPLTALSVGLKVDADALPPALIEAIVDGQVDLTDPATTLALIELDAVVGVVGKVKQMKGAKRLVSVGVTCALCHSTVDDSVLPGIGSRLDGWPNRDLDPGAILALSPAIPDESKAIYRSWGPGKFDPRFNIDGQSTPIVIPPAFGLSGVKRETFTGDGKLSYWNKYVAVTQMGGHGTFVDPELDIRIVQHPDMVARWLPTLRDYQLGLDSPPPPAGSFDAEAASRGEELFHGAANCASCHVPPLYTDINHGVLHAAEETGMDPSYAQRTKTGLYRTTPLRALWQHPPYFHDGSAATLLDVVEHYDAYLDLQLTESERHDLVEFLKSL